MLLFFVVFAPPSIIVPLNKQVTSLGTTAGSLNYRRIQYNSSSYLASACCTAISSSTSCSSTNVHFSHRLIHLPHKPALWRSTLCFVHASMETLRRRSVLYCGPDLGVKKIFCPARGGSKSHHVSPPFLYFFFFASNTGTSTPTFARRELAGEGRKFRFQEDHA